MCRARRTICFSVILLMCADAIVAANVRDWNAHPAVIDRSQPGVLYVVGDVHGDADTLAVLLAGAKVIDSGKVASASWCGGKATLLCTGDLLDKYQQQLTVIDLCRRLQAEAAAAGGRVIVTMGNHEAEFLAGQRDDSDFAHELRHAGIDPAVVVAGTDAGGIGTWLRELPIAAKVGDWFFCHAGNTHGMSVAQLEAAAEQQMGSRGYNVPLLLDPNSLLEARMHPRPWWDYDGTSPELRETHAQQKQDKTTATDPGQPRLLANLRALGVHHLVFGHQPGEIKFLDNTRRPAGTIYSKWNNTVILIDTGMSRGVASGRGAVLKIEGQHVTPIDADGAIEPLGQ